MYEFKLRINISGWLILALLLVILLCHFVPAVSAAETQMYLYNGVELPDINTVWDKDTYPYVFIRLSGTEYHAWFSSVPFVGINSQFASPSTNGAVVRYKSGTSSSLTEWTLVLYQDALVDSQYGVMANMFWANYDILNSDGSVYLAASDPVPVGGSDPSDPSEPTSAVRPVFIVNVPFVSWLEYNVGDTPTPVTVEAVVDDGGTISYTWYRTIFAESGSPSNVVFSTGSTLVPDTSVVSDSSYYCVATNTNGKFSQSAYSRAYRVKVVESGAVDPPSETPTYPSAEDIGSSVGDAFQGVLDQHDINTSEQGNSFVDQMTEIIPNHSDGFLDALGGLIVSLGYTGTECVLTVPALVMPQIGDLVPQYTLLEKHEVDLESYFNMFPDFLVTLVQSLFTAALIVFCFREFYFVVSYVLTLRWRDKDE